MGRDRLRRQQVNAIIRDIAAGRRAQLPDHPRGRTCAEAEALIAEYRERAIRAEVALGRFEAETARAEALRRYHEADQICPSALSVIILGDIEAGADE